MFKFDPGIGMIFDADTGDCLKSEAWHWQAEGPRSYWIVDREGRTTFSFLLERLATDPSGLHDGAATHVEIRLHKATEHSQWYPKKSDRFLGESHREIDRLIEYFQSEVVGKLPKPCVVLTDCRKKRKSL